jgi:cell division protein FtsB
VARLRDKIKGTRQVAKLGGKLEEISQRVARLGDRIKETKQGVVRLGDMIKGQCKEWPD